MILVVRPWVPRQLTHHNVVGRLGVVSERRRESLDIHPRIRRRRGDGIADHGPGQKDRRDGDHCPDHPQVCRMQLAARGRPETDRSRRQQQEEDGVEILVRSPGAQRQGIECACISIISLLL